MTLESFVLASETDLICPTMCSGCAFRPSSEANTYGPTQLKAKLCLQLRAPFFCHEKTGPAGKPLICRGFVTALADCDKSESNCLSEGQRAASEFVLNAIRGLGSV